MTQSTAVRAPRDAATIAQRAYEIYERSGRPEGHALDHWLQAEAELAREAKRGSASPLSTSPATSHQSRSKSRQPAMAS